MPSLADLRRRIAVPRSALEQPAGTEESLVTDTRCRISPIQAVESKLSSILRRAEERLQQSVR